MLLVTCASKSDWCMTVLAEYDRGQDADYCLGKTGCKLLTYIADASSNSMQSSVTVHPNITFACTR